MQAVAAVVLTSHPALLVLVVLVVVEMEQSRAAAQFRPLMGQQILAAAAAVLATVWRRPAAMVAQAS